MKNSQFNRTAIWATIFAFFLTLSAYSQADTAKKPVEEKPKKWFELLSLRGYAQLRYNRLLETNDKLKCDQCDKSWGDNNTIFLRRARIVLFGDVHPHLGVYIQFDYAAQPASSTQQHFLQIRDAYFDLNFDKKKVYRVRVGQSKVPFGFENLQSSQNRLPLDRADALNSALPNERDMGAFFYWTPVKRQEIMEALNKDGMKHSGNYGMFALGFYNGQTANTPEKNDLFHVVSRFSYPMNIGSQVIEPHVEAYTGRFVLLSTSEGVATSSDKEYDDQRVAGGFVLYPKPFGIQAEYNVGTSPGYDAETDSIGQQDVSGGQVTLCYRRKIDKHVLIPFVRAQYFRGSKKAELDARHYEVDEYEFGVEWLPFKNFELTAMYTMSHRVTADYINELNDQEGSLVRLQLQFNY
ncbi:MAG: porin [Flavobacteriales bacterium]|nr:porin [Flavobacteriales bacterium]